MTRALHKVTDASALNAFLSDWAVAACDNQAARETPLFISAMLPVPRDPRAVPASGREQERKLFHQEDRVWGLQDCPTQGHGSGGILSSKIYIK